LNKAVHHIGLDDHRRPCGLRTADIDEAESGAGNAERQKLARKIHGSSPKKNPRSNPILLRRA